MEDKRFLEDENIYLRPFTRGDVPIWVSWFNDPKVTRYMNKGMVPLTEEDQLDHLKKLEDDKKNIQLAIVEKENNRLVGSIGLHNIDWLHRTGSVSVLVGDRTSWGRGYGAAAISLIVAHAFWKLNLNKVNAGMWANNRASEESFKKNGFVLEGRRAQQYFCDGAYVDELNYGLLRSSWQEKNRG